MGMTQLYTKNSDGKYEKVHWKNIKMTPNVKIKKIIEKNKCRADSCSTYLSVISIETLLKELGIPK